MNDEHSRMLSIIQPENSGRKRVDVRQSVFGKVLLFRRGCRDGSRELREQPQPDVPCTQGPAILQCSKS